MQNIITCRTLVGSKNLTLSIECLRSFIIHSFDEVHLEIFEDGSLTEEDKSRLTGALKNCVIIDKKIREEIVKDRLAQYPNCLHFINHQRIMSMKLFDIMLYDDQDFWYVDSDVFFLRKFRLPAFNDQPVFMLDCENSYSFNPLEFLKIKLPVYSFINAGFNHFPKKYFDLGFIEKFLENEIIIKNISHVVAEQTVWAFLATSLKQMNFFDSSQILMATEKMTINKNVIGIHFISTYRYHFEEVKQLYSCKIPESSYEQIRLKKASSYLKKIQFAAGRLRKRMNWQLKSLHLLSTMPQVSIDN